VHIRKYLKIKLCLIITVFLICFSFSSFVYVCPSLGNPDYTYYGVVPAKIYNYNLTDTNNRDSGWRLNTGSVGNSSLLVIAASEDSTHVKVYDLTLDKLASEFNINNMEKHYVLLANDTTFKVVSNNQVSVMLLNYHRIPATTDTSLSLPYGFYTSTDGLYIGKKFVIMGSGGGTSNDYTLLALENARVTVTRDDNTQYSYSLDANSYKNILLSPFSVFKIESTGNIMIQTGGIPGVGTGPCSCFPIPSATGGFVGTFFLTKSLKSEWSWDAKRDYGFKIEATEDTTVQVYDLETKQLMSEYKVTGGSGIRIQPQALAIGVQSDKPITMSFIHNGSIEMTAASLGGGAGIIYGGKYSGYANGVMFIGIKPNQDTMVHMPTEAYVEAYFFANEETDLTIDGGTQTLQAGSSYLFNQPGTHIISSNKNVMLQINFWPNEPENQGLVYNGAIIPCIETVANNPTVTITPLGEGFPIMYIIIGAGATAAAVIVVVLVMRKQGRKPI
jgi:hypothetical protein